MIYLFIEDGEDWFFGLVGEYVQIFVFVYVFLYYVMVELFIFCVVSQFVWFLGGVFRDIYQVNVFVVFEWYKEVVWNGYYVFFKDVFYIKCI